MTLHGSAVGHDGASTPLNGLMLRRLVEAVGSAGVIGAGDLLVSEQDTPDDTLKVAGGLGIVDADGSGLFGRYLVINNGDASTPAFTPTSGDGRIDEVIVRVTDGEPELEIVEGTPAGSPVAPSITGDNYLHLAEVTIPPTTSVIDDSMIEDMRESAASPLVAAADVQVFTSSDTWIKPSATSYREVYVACIAGGGGGGSGRKGAVSSDRGGGGGGGGGGYSEATLPLSELADSETVTVGAGGPGAADVTANSTNGSAGTAGGNSSFGDHVTAFGGAAGGGGSTSAGAGGAGGVGVHSGGDGGNGLHSGTAEAGDASAGAAGGGGGGGGIPTSNSGRSGGAGGATLRPSRVGGAGGVGSAGSPGNGNAGGDLRPLCGSGGGGAASGFASNGGGGLFGGGGGGGGAGLNSVANGGGGGDGGDGVVVVITR